MNLPQNASKQPMHSLAVCGALSGEKHFFKYLSLFNVLIKKSCLNKSKFS